MRASSSTLILALLALLPGCPTVNLGTTGADIGTCKPDKDYFVGVIWPDYILRDDAPMKSCVQGGCHDPGGNGGSLHFEVDPVDDDANYKRATGSRLSCGSPEESELLTKPLGAFDHQHVFVPGADEVGVFLAWFDQ